VLFATHLAAVAVAGRASRLSTAWLVVGAAIPDVIDKPLGMIGVFELYHSIGHSTLIVPIFVLLALRDPAGLAAAVGWGSHLLLDAIHVVINGRPGHALFLAWPLAESADPLALPPGEFGRYYLGTPSFRLEILIWIGLIAVLASQRMQPRSDE
jgi:Ni/Fe-hydrogenase subunit HybB-like protein